MNLFDFGSGLASFIGLFLTLYNIYQVKNVKKFIKKYSEQVDLSSVLNTMDWISNLLEEILKSKVINNNQVIQVNNAIKSIHESIGLVEGVNRVYFNEIAKVNVEYYDTGYYNDEFFNNIILNAKSKIIIFGRRSTRIMKQENKIKFFTLLDKINICIELFYFDPNVSDEYIEIIRRMSPSSPTKEEMRRTQEKGRNTYIELKKKSKRAYAIDYFEYDSFPYFNFVVVDKYFYWGIVNYPKNTNNKESIEVRNEYELRPYIRFLINDRFPKYILNICEEVKKECRIKGKVY